MKTKVQISFRATNIPEEAAAILVSSGCGPDVAKVSDITIVKTRSIRITIDLDEGDERVAKVLALLQQQGVEVKPITYIEYSEEDRQNARLLRVLNGGEEDVSAGLREGTKYDMSAACANCGTGARQTSALYVDGDALPMIRKHRAIGSFDHDILVDGGMVKKLKDAGVTGISFGDVRARLRNDKWSSVARDQILIEHTMPPMRSALTADDKKSLCNVCQRGGRDHFPQKPYGEEDLVGMQDFNLTWEWFGGFWPADPKRQRLEKRPNPYVLVTPKVMNIFRDAGVKTFEWWPVGIEG